MLKIKLPVDILPEFLEICNQQVIPVMNSNVFGDDYGSLSYTCTIEDKFITNLFLSKVGKSIIISNDETMIPFYR